MPPCEFQLWSQGQAPKRRRVEPAFSRQDIMMVTKSINDEMIRLTNELEKTRELLEQARQENSQKDRTIKQLNAEIKQFRDSYYQSQQQILELTERGSPRNS